MMQKLMLSHALLLQIYSGHMERAFVPVEKRGEGQANIESNVPSHLRNDNPHSDHTEAKAGNGMGLFAYPCLRVKGSSHAKLCIHANR